MCMTLLWVIPKTVSPPALPGKRFLQIGSARSAAWARICSRRSNPEHPDTNDKRRSRKWSPLFCVLRRMGWKYLWKSISVFLLKMPYVEVSNVDVCIINF